MSVFNMRSSYLLTLLTLAIPFFSVSQDEPFKQVQQKFEAFSKTSAQEKIYVHTDKNYYVAGEIIWFKLYYLDAATHQKTDISKVAYVEILDKAFKPVLQAKVSLNPDGGAGSLYLPLTLNSDNYILRAYTTWMRNSGPSVFFEKLISVVNTVKPADGSRRQEAGVATAVFFPEGGNMVDGIETKVGFRITGENGRGINAGGVITKENGDTVVKFSPYKFGIGNFTFKPVANQEYKATITIPGGKSVTTLLPTVYEYGYVMDVTDNNDGRIKVRIRIKMDESKGTGEKVSVLMHNRQVLKAAETGFVNNTNELVFQVEKTKLGEGISQVTLFNKDGRPVCERLVFVRPNGQSTTNINTDKDTYGVREQVSLAINGDTTKSFDGMNYSVAVYQIDSLEKFDSDDIVSYLWLKSDLRGEIESPGYYFGAGKSDKEAMDNLLLTHGWRRFKWETVLSAASFTPRFIPEKNGHLVTARVVNINDKSPAKNINCFLSSPGYPYVFCVAKTDDRGIVQFDAKKYFGPGEVVVQAGQDSVTRYQVDVLTPFAEEHTDTRVPAFILEKRNENDLLDKSIAMQSQNIYLADSIRRFDQPVLADTLPFFGKAEFTYPLDEYKRFTTMEEVLREYVTPINVVLRDGKLYMTMYDELYAKMYGDAAQAIYRDKILVLLDGVPLMNYNRIFSYDPFKVKKLDVVPRRFMIGGISFNGVASFETYQGRFDGFELTPGLVAVDYEGLQLQREFYSPVYENMSDREKRIPDFRTTLFWTPDVRNHISGNLHLKFFTSDLPGKYLVVVQGLNEKADAVSATHSFTVK